MCQCASSSIFFCRHLPWLSVAKNGQGPLTGTRAIDLSGVVSAKGVCERPRVDLLSACNFAFFFSDQTRTPRAWHDGPCEAKAGTKSTRVASVRAVLLLKDVDVDDAPINCARGGGGHELQPSESFRNVSDPQYEFGTLGGDDMGKAFA